MKFALTWVSNRVILLALFPLLSISEALPLPGGITGKEANIHYETLVRKVYGPWSEVRKFNGEYADYGEYLTGVQDFQPDPEDVPADEPEVAESGPADFQSNYGEPDADESESDVPFQLPSADDQSVNLQGDSDQIIAGDPEFEGNVQWTSAAT